MTYGAQVETPAPTITHGMYSRRSLDCPFASIVRSVELGGNCSPGFVVAKM
jgi:hypothetical protein